MNVNEIIRDFNQVMKKYYTKGASSHNNDQSVVLDEEYFSLWRAVAPYMSYAPEIWKDYDQNSFEVDQPSMGAFAKCGMLKDMFNRIPSFEYRKRRERELFVIKNIDKVREIRNLWHAQDSIRITGDCIATQELEFYDGPEEEFGKYGDKIVHNLSSDKVRRIDNLYEALNQEVTRCHLGSDPMSLR
jgi:hypothetical protein